MKGKTRLWKLGIAYWTNCNIKINLKQMKLLIEREENNQIFDLKLYLLRKSTKSPKDTLVLEVAGEFTEKFHVEMKLIYLQLKKTIFPNVFESIQHSIIQYRN